MISVFDGDKVKDIIRGERNWTVAHFAAEVRVLANRYGMKISHQAVYNHLNGICQPQVPQFFVYKRVLNVDDGAITKQVPMGRPS